ncbi:MAG TPA: transposase [Edaphobacter sp.]|nr:transposase [Edaphobacter sp.]
MFDNKQSSPRERRGEGSPSVSNDAEVRSELERILTSDFFKGSARCQDFLKQVVWIACSESPESIRERTIGIAVFGRAPDYDTGADAIVRVKASEVRRRLAQYNQNADPQRPVAIELSPGSYAPKITRCVPQEPLAVSVVPKRAFESFSGVNYALGQWNELNVFCSDGAVPIDNNVSEREMKRIVLNRKNSLFVGNPRGGRTAAILASLTSTCRRHDIDPQLYLTQLLVNLPFATIRKLHAWLPDQWKQRQTEPLANI